MNIDLTTTDIVLLAIAVLLTALISYIYYRGKSQSLETKCDLLSEAKALLQQELTQERELLRDSQDRVSGLQATLATVQADFANLRRSYDDEIKDSQQRLIKFEHLATRVLDAQKESFDHHQKKGLVQLLEPLQQQIIQFERKVEHTNEQAIQRHTSLKEQINFLRDGNAQISQEANNLTKALKGDTKMQGNWGELILESILDRSGLIKDQEYHVQVSERDANGSMLRPDVVISLPDGKKLIVDSKVSLRAYDAMISATDEDMQKQYQKAHVNAVKDHVNRLSVKNYQHLHKMESPDFVMMFVPIDTAFSAALKGDEGLYNYAFDQNIVIVTPSTLLATLKTVETLWRNDKQNRYALQIASEAGKMYDKFASFAGDMSKLGEQINTVQTTYHKTLNKLNTGQGNLLKRAEKLKELGAKATKRMPLNLLQDATDEPAGIENMD